MSQNEIPEIKAVNDASKILNDAGIRYTLVVVDDQQNAHHVGNHDAYMGFVVLHYVLHIILQPEVERLLGMENWLEKVARNAQKELNKNSVSVPFGDGETSH